jgi:glutamine synthetase
MYSASPKAKRIEFRPPDPLANPYLAFSAMLMAGLDGIERELDPGEPIDRNLYELAPEQLAGIPTVPTTLDESLDALEADHAFLTHGGVFTDDLIATWLDYKRTMELDELRLRPHPHEFELYYDV